jgi:nucleoside-diphosphate-sugar epimerase
VLKGFEAEGEDVRAKSALVCGAGGFIGGHLVKRLKRDGFWVRGVDLKFHEFSETQADDFGVGDLRDQDFCRAIADRRFDEVYQLAADMGGAGYIFTGEHDAEVMRNSAINLNIVRRFRLFGQLPRRNKLKGPGSRLLVSFFPEIKFILSWLGVL